MQNFNRSEAAGSLYRPDIDGLRAVAVVPVVLYHYGVAPFSGGYVGVDVFFVISGFLITSLIHVEMAQGRFSIVDFYERRVRRIFPALFAVLAVSTALAFWLLFPSDLQRFGDSLLTTTIFGSNILFWSESGYFDAAASVKPLLHTWSLAVEEQFYLIFPWILFLARKASRRALLIIVFGILVVSLGLNIWSVRTHPDFAFYWLPPRAWELMLGAVLAIGNIPLPESKIAREALSALGLVLIAVAVFAFTVSTPFPGEAALLPCVGAALIIYAAPGTRVGALLGAGPMVWIGLLSYSLYLWHWPLLVFARYATFGDLNAWQTALLIALSVALAALSLRFVERPFRGHSSGFTRSRIFLPAGIAMLAAIALGAAASLSNGVPQRFDANTRAILAEADQRDLSNSPCFDAPIEKIRKGFFCHIGARTNAPPSFIVWGDSHAGVLEPVISNIMAARGQSGLYLARSTCVPMPGVSVSRSAGCNEENAAMAKAALLPSVKDVILIAHWARYAEAVPYRDGDARDVFITDTQSPEPGVAVSHGVFARGLQSTVAVLAGAHKKIIIVAQVPEVAWDIPEAYAREQARGGGPDLRTNVADYLARQKFVFEQFEIMRKKYGVTIVYPHSLLCAWGQCEVAVRGRPIYRDRHHLTPDGASLIAPLLEGAL
ncbi:MAG TPA: acyltransferase family protein [Rhizomicrobium sp.]|jgi:peptidoglycan/LPS O-acetylase OafA/YrhL|nr:acyltransferase family protein [Rhizomicrobium sp.]